MRRLTIAVAILSAVIGAGAAVALSRRAADPLAAASHRVEADGGWDTAAHAGEALASIGEVLLRAGTSCGRGPHCDDLLSASAWTQVAAVRILRCTRPDVFQTRTDARAIVTALRARAPRPTLPPIPRC